MEDRLSRSLLDLIKKSIIRRDELFKGKKLQITPIVFEKSNVSQFDYSIDSIGYRVSFDYVKKDRWDSKDKFDFVENFSKELEEYKNSVEEITKRFERTQAQAESWLGTFLHKILDKNIGGGFDDSLLIESISIFLNDLNRNQIEWNVKVYLNALYIGESPLNIHQNINIRKVEPSDLEYETVFNIGRLKNFNRPPDRTTSAILTLSELAVKGDELDKETNVIVDVLRMFKLGSVHHVKKEYNSNSFLRGDSISYTHRQKSATFKYFLEEKDYQDFIELFEVLFNPINNTYDSINRKQDYFLSLAFDRFEDALVKPVPFENKITSSITSLEALLLKDSEKTELSHRLAQRISKLLANSQFPSIKIYNEVKRAYGIRSTFIHGSQLSEKKKENIEKLCENILDYNRLCLCAFLQLSENNKKEKIINKIDNALINTDANKSFEKMMTTTVKFP